MAGGQEVTWGHTRAGVICCGEPPTHPDPRPDSEHALPERTAGSPGRGLRRRQTCLENGAVLAERLPLDLASPA